MRWLSLRPVRLALPAVLGVVACLARPAVAQIPAYVPAEPELSAPPAEAAPVAPAVAPAASPASEPTELPAAPAAPPGLPAAPPGVGPALARTAVLTERSAVPAVEEPADADEGGELGPRRTWYGWQTLTVDGASFALLLLSAAASSGPSRGNDGASIAVLGVASYLFTPGIIHFVHRNPGRGFASFGIRVGLPIAGAMVGAAAASGCNEYLCEGGGAALGALLGIGGAIAIDAAVFAYDDRKPRDATLSGFSPVVLLSRDRALLGVAGKL